MRANYHTHTWRCHHAYGTEKEYVEKAIESGMEILGFSDHAPYPFPDGYEASNKMLPSQLEDYVNTVLDIRREYEGQITQHVENRRARQTQTSSSYREAAAIAGNHSRSG